MEQLSYQLHELQLQENQVVPALKQKLADVEEKIENILTAIESGVILKTTKSRLEKLEKEQEALTIELAEAEIKSPLLTQEQILFGLTKFRKLDLNTKIGKQTLIDGFVNKIYLYDDYALITCNYKDGTEKITLEDIEESDVSKALKAQKNKPEQECSDLFKSGDPNGIRTHDTTVKGWCLNRLTMGPRRRTPLLSKTI